MKIAFVYDAVYPWETGGAQKRVWELARRLAPRHDVHWYGMHYWDGPRTLERDNVTLHGVCDPLPLYTNGRRSIPQALTFAAALTPRIMSADYDVVDCQQFPYFPIFAGKLHELVRETAFIVTWYEVWDEYWLEYLGQLGHLGRLVERLTLQLGDVVVPISAAIADDLRSIGRERAVTVVPNGVDFEKLSSAPTGDHSDIVYVGRLAEHKRVRDLLAAIASIDREVSCTIIGDGPERSRLEKVAQSLEIAESVTFCGFLDDHEDVVSVLSGASLFVLPSEREGVPNTILEAGACGVPSIVVDHTGNGATSLVEDGKTGRIVEPDISSLAGAIEDCLADKSHRDRLATGARRQAKAHDWAEITTTLESVYQCATGGG